MGEKSKSAICKVNSLVEPPLLHSDLFFAILTPNTRSVMLKPNVYGYRYSDSTAQFTADSEYSDKKGMEQSGKKKEFLVKDFEESQTSKENESNQSKSNLND